jgi:mono/diheme cytochrome c family protein
MSFIWPRKPIVLPLLGAALVGGCGGMPSVPTPEALIERGERIFFTETFDGNGRTCGSCHRAEDNFGLSPAFMATLAPDDPVFVAETSSDLSKNFENPRLLREFGLILENLDGFEDLDNKFVLRGIPHTLALRTSVNSADGPRTGWSGDGAPGDRSLRSFATGAVIQHLAKTTSRIDGVDFRLPTDEELDALEAFQLSLGRQEELSLPMPLKSRIAARGQAIFMDRAGGKCNACHFNAGANVDPSIFGQNAGNLNFDTGVEMLLDQPADLTEEIVPPDDGHGIPGNGEFNTPPLVEAADTGPFFHNNAIQTIEGAVAFYNGDAFNRSPAGNLIRSATGSGINLDATQVDAVAAFLRVINALENIRASDALLATAQTGTALDDDRRRVLLSRAKFEIEDGAQVLSGGGLHPAVAAQLRNAQDLVERTLEEDGNRRLELINEARVVLADARGQMIKI